MMDIATDGRIVFHAARRLGIAPTDIEASLQDSGLVSADSRTYFRELVYSGVLKEGLKSQSSTYLLRERLRSGKSSRP
jgi:hypothetical protein